MLDKVKTWMAAHTSAVAAVGLFGAALVDASQQDWMGAGKALIGAAGLLHLWSVSPPAPDKVA